MCYQDHRTRCVVQTHVDQEHLYRNIVLTTTLYTTLPADVTAILVVLAMSPTQVIFTPPEPTALTIEGLKVNVLILVPLALSVRMAVNPPLD